MSTKVQFFHLSSEARYILYRLRNEIDFQLNKDVVDGFDCEMRSLGNLLPLIYKAFIRLWCCKDKSLVVKKKFRSIAGLCDYRTVTVEYDFFESLLHDARLYREEHNIEEPLPF